MSEIIASGITSPQPLQQLLDTYKPLVDEFRIHLNDDGLLVRAIEPANVAYAITQTDPHAFEQYDSPGSVTIGVNIERLEEAISVADKDDLLEFEVDMETRKLIVHVRNITQRVRLIDPGAMRSDPERPDVEVPNYVTVKGWRLKESVRVADMVSDHVQINCHPEEKQVVFLAEGDDDDNEIEYGREEVEDAKIVEESETLFSVDYLKALSKPIPDEADVTLSLGTELPLFTEWETLDRNQHVEQFLGPRIVGD